ncbi:MAG: hypothetical protein ABJB66_00175, partial [Gemmatimonadaceae bacterium]
PSRCDAQPKNPIVEVHMQAVAGAGIVLALIGTIRKAQNSEAFRQPRRGARSKQFGRLTPCVPS